MYDVIIIGGGVTGCATAAELAKYELGICVIEKESDVCEGTSKANSAIVHAGFDAEPGTLKAKLNVRGNAMIRELNKKLDFASNFLANFFEYYNYSSLCHSYLLKKNYYKIFLFVFWFYDKMIHLLQFHLQMKVHQFL